jgi:hypothetical protein
MQKTRELTVIFFTEVTVVYLISLSSPDGRRIIPDQPYGTCCRSFQNITAAMINPIAVIR